MVKFIRTMMHGLLTILVPLAVPSATSAQEDLQEQRKSPIVIEPKRLPLGVVPGEYTLMALIEDSRVVKELNLTEEQVVKVKETKDRFTSIRTRFIKEMEDRLKKVDGEERIKLRGILETERYDKIAALVKEADDHLVQKILDKSRATRLKQIRLQAEGPKALERPEVQVNLDLLPGQIQEIRRIVFSNSRQYMKAAKVSTDNNDADISTKRNEPKQKYDDAIKKLSPN